MSAPHLNTFLFTLWLCSRNISQIFFLGISMFEGQQNTTETLLAWVSTSRFVTEVKSSTAGTEFQIISSFRENYSSEIMHNIYRYLHILAFSVIFSSWEYYKIRKYENKENIGPLSKYNMITIFENILLCWLSISASAHPWSLVSVCSCWHHPMSG